jgi:hypothetical protein
MVACEIKGRVVKRESSILPHRVGQNLRFLDGFLQWRNALPARAPR